MLILNCKIDNQHAATSSKKKKGRSVAWAFGIGLYVWSWQLSRSWCTSTESRCNLNEVRTRVCVCVSAGAQHTDCLCLAAAVWFWSREAVDAAVGGHRWRSCTAAQREGVRGLGWREEREGGRAVKPSRHRKRINEPPILFHSYFSANNNFISLDISACPGWRRAERLMGQTVFVFFNLRN